jgi:hypothetical protein
MVRVIATARGFDGICVREPGEEFDMPETVFAPRPKRDDKGKRRATSSTPRRRGSRRRGKPAQTGPEERNDLA